MIPIYEQGSGKGIGHGLESFLDRFHAIAQEHVNQNRAKAFAFVFYDFCDNDLKQILKDEGVFVQLDRLAERDLSVFFLHSGSQHSIQKFNSTLQKALGVESETIAPCVVFCKVANDGFTNIIVARLDSADLIHGFTELYAVIEKYKEGLNPPLHLKYLTLAKGSVAFVALETLKAVISELIKRNWP